MRLGLCCLFARENIKFRTTTVKALLTLDREHQLAKLSALCRQNAESLLLAVKKVHELGFGAFRISSPLFPSVTHPVVGYSLDFLADCQEISQTLAQVKTFANQHALRLSFHPDQFVVLSSPNQEVVANSLRELNYQADLAEMVGADVLTIHGGGVYGDKHSALERLSLVVDQLPAKIRSRLALENDDISYTVGDLLPICNKLGLPLVYDVHHHRCNPDDLSVEEATESAAATWQAVGREQYCHISSPREGWAGKKSRSHADYIDLKDFPDCWLNRDMTIDVEAKAKELAVSQLLDELGKKSRAEDMPNHSTL